MFLFLALLTITSCHLSDENKLKIAWHNLISRDNIWFHANEKVNAAFESMQTQNGDNFEKILPVFPYGTADQRKGLATEMDEVMKKCSKVISDHKISKWVDDCFYLLGEAQFLKNDYYAAIETFQYLNAKYKTTELRYLSSIWIMKSYVYAGRADEAEAIMGYYKTEGKWPEKYQGELSAILGDIYIRQEKYKPAINRMRDAFARTHKKTLKARYSFILGQLYQQTGRGDSATYFFKKCIKYNPNYDMAFSAKMNIAKSANLSDPSKKNQAKRLMKNLLRDDKNISYFDQIYYELGRIEEKDKNIPAAINYYKLSALSSRKNNTQKSLSYLSLADIYFAKPDYKNAQAYYDSTALFIPKESKNYEVIMEKKNVLGELVHNITTIKLQDSLLKLAAMDTNKLYRYLEKAIEDKKSQKEDLDNNNNLNLANPINTTNIGGTGFYFSNPSLVGAGITEFYRKWGQRNNTDFWRVAAKAREFTEQQSNSTTTENTTQTDTLSKTTPLVTRASPEMKKMLAQIPFSEAAKKSATNKISDAYAGNGDIYYDKLNDIGEAKESYLTLIDKYTGYEKLDKVLYKLYKISNTQNDSAQAEKYRKWLIEKFPKSPYTLLLTSPHKNYKPKQANTEVVAYYNSIYDSYLKADYNSAKTQLGDVDKKFPGTGIKPKFDLLDALIEARTKNLTNYESKLKLVQNKYPNTPEAEKADGLLKALEKLKKGEIDMGDSTINKVDSSEIKENKSLKKGNYQNKYSSRFFYVLLVPTSIPNTEEVKIKFADHNAAKHTLEGLESKLLEFNTTYQLFRINEFKDKPSALKYLLEIDGKQTILNEAGIKEVRHFIISDENFLELYNTKDYEGYIEFYNKNF